MKLSCNKNELYKLVSLAERSTNKNPTLIALSSILLRTGKNQLFIISTNLEVAFEGSLAASVDEDGEILSPGKTLLSVLYAMPDEEVDLNSAGGNLKIVSKTSSVNLKCLNMEEFPTIPKIKKENHFQKTCQEVIRIFEDSGDDIDITFNKNQILFQNKKISFLSRLTEGKFPEYQTIIPKSFDTQVFTDKNQILNAVRAAGIFSSKLSEVTIAVDGDKGILGIKSSNAETGEYESNYQTKISGASVEANFNYHYLLEALQTISNQKVFMGFNGPQKAVLIRGADDAGYLHLVMPMRGN